MSSETFFLDKAYDQAELAFDVDEVPVGAVLVENGQVVAKGYNLKEQRCCVTAHAEILCLQSLTQQRQDWRLTDCVLYTTLEPCVMCAGAIIHARIKRVVCGALDPKGGAESVYKIFSSKQLNHHCDFKVEYHVKSQQLLRQFFKQRR